jgi:hypothetical protein
MSELLDTLKPVEPKHPNSVKFYTMDWTDYLNSGATISSQSWSITPSGLTNVSDAIVTGGLKATIKVSGGVDGTDYQVTNTIVTSDGETEPRTGVIKVRRT